MAGATKVRQRNREGGGETNRADVALPARQKSLEVHIRPDHSALPEGVSSSDDTLVLTAWGVGRRDERGTVE
eukprot:CAMPEP_0172528590 /NCGR_PEP_ID=MMETSP1067-20121228/2943_1 /TAXON_ID=265564 ORGANISM="Thalassiosira punctigera, Strain Tpunct2005C2" /NCGR_SAMPLE_ID=MMETSP1067 /ASSEMBLY_ACC=CAM_ASM_000444 /LENGTH=71 /DNA_ID=CAMNT_0013312531 /DNA_START=695 /DNA_END=907 /DNA_ORIENTATION=-